MSVDLASLAQHLGQLQGWVQTVDARTKTLEGELTTVKAELNEMKAKAAAKAAAAAKRGAGAKRGGGEEKFPGTLVTYFKKNELPKIAELPTVIQQIYAAKTLEYAGVADESKRKKEIESATWKSITEVIKNKDKDDNHRAVAAYHAKIDAEFKAGKKAWETAHPKPVSDAPAGMPPALNLASPMPNIAGLSLGTLPGMPVMPSMPGALPPGVAPAPVAAPAPVPVFPGMPMVPAFPPK